MIIQFNYINFEGYNRHLYVLFDNHDQYREWAARQTIPHTFNEVLIGDTYRRIVFDIDRPNQPFTLDELREIRDVLTQRVAQVYGFDINSSEFAVYTSQHPDEPKGSCHILSKTLTMRNYHEHRELYQRLKVLLTEKKEMHPWIKYIL